MWSWSPATVTPDGGGISAGCTLTADCIGTSTQQGTCIPSVTFQAIASNEGTAEGSLDILGYGLRDCIGVGSGTGLCDVGNGLTVRKGTSEVRNTNLLEFQGNLTFSGSYGKALVNILAGSGDAELTYATRIDFVDSTTMYKGEAAVGSADGDASWRISKYVFSADGDTSITWGSGNDTFDKVWSNRASLSYS